MKRLRTINKKCATCQPIGLAPTVKVVGIRSPRPSTGTERGDRPVQ